MNLKRIAATSVATVIALSASAGFAATSAKRYTVPIAPDYETKALFSVGDTVPWADDTSRSYQMVGIPDGLGAHANDDGTTTLYMNHEFTNNVTSEPLIGGPRYRGSYVSRFTLDEDGDPNPW